MHALQASQDRCQELETEAAVLIEQFTSLSTCTAGDLKQEPALYALQASQERCQELETEAAVLSDELARVAAVAARAAAREVVNGSKDEGVVPVSQHLEEVACLQYPVYSPVVLGHLTAVALHCLTGAMLTAV